MRLWIVSPPPLYNTCVYLLIFHIYPFPGLITMTIRMMITLEDDRQEARIAAAKRIGLVLVPGTDVNDLTPKTPIPPTPLNAARRNRQSTRRLKRKKGRSITKLIKKRKMKIEKKRRLSHLLMSLWGKSDGSAPNALLGRTESQMISQTHLKPRQLNSLRPCQPHTISTQPLEKCPIIIIRVTTIPMRISGDRGRSRGSGTERMELKLHLESCSIHHSTQQTHSIPQQLLPFSLSISVLKQHSLLCLRQ